MTKNERLATMRFLSNVKSAANEAKRYGDDFDSQTMKAIGVCLEEAIDRFKKEAEL